MKRILLILILLFPIVTLVLYVYLTMSRSHPTTPPVVQTNSNFSSSPK